MQSNATINICIAVRCFYIASLYNDMFRPLYWPSSGCTLSYFKANYTIYSVFVSEISCTVFSISMHTDTGVLPTPYLFSFMGAKEAGAWGWTHLRLVPFIEWTSTHIPVTCLQCEHRHSVFLVLYPPGFPFSFLSVCKFLGAFPESWRANSSFVMCVPIRLSVCPSDRQPARNNSAPTGCIFVGFVMCGGVYVWVWNVLVCVCAGL
jgi:hypothetical protein